jgi:hypothetical protein
MNEDNEVRVLAYCAECENEIHDDVEEYYCDEDGNFFCDIECACIYHGIHRLEL